MASHLKLPMLLKSCILTPSPPILTPDGETEYFDILAGILQGDTLAPFLFIIVIVYIMHVSVDTMKENGLLYQPKRSSRYPALHITDADFADDIALLSDNLANAQALNQQQTALVSI